MKILSAHHSGHQIDRLRTGYFALASAQGLLVLLYETHHLASTIAGVGGLGSALLGPVFSLRLAQHVFRHPRKSHAVNLGTIALTYLVTASSFAILYVLISNHNPRAFAQPAVFDPVLTLGSAAYFSFTTITTTGFGDIAPVSGLARTFVCWEMATGLVYQVTVFSLVASLNSVSHVEEISSA